jgi:hypothetical protein
MNNMHTWFGIETALSALVLIGFGHFWVVLVEKYLGHAWKPVVFGIGALVLIGSICIPNDFLSMLAGVLGATILWGSLELEDQAKRCRLGWYPDHQPKIDPPWLHKE